MGVRSSQFVKEWVKQSPGIGRTFQFFDRDGSGAIDLEEFTNALKLRCGLQFEEGLLKGLIDQWDTERTGELNFANFCAMVMQKYHLRLKNHT